MEIVPRFLLYKISILYSDFHSWVVGFEPLIWVANLYYTSSHEVHFLVWILQILAHQVSWAFKKFSYSSYTPKSKAAIKF
jgi:hypothetical protein